MRKKFVKSDRPTYKRRITKAQEGIKFAKYTAIETPQVDYSISNPTNPFSEYNIPTVYNTEKALIVPEVAAEPTEEVINNEPIQEVTKPTEYKVTKFTGSKDFINKMRPIFTVALSKRGLDPKYADYLVAQSALESGWGKSQSGKFNLGGIKGKGSVKKTREVIDGKDVYINDSFRDFNSLEDYADYHVGLLNNNRYRAFNTDDFIGSVVKGGYATDPKYRTALSKMYKQVVSARNGGIIKYRDGGVAKRDAIKDYKPQEKVSPIKRVYTPTQSYVTQDNRSKWQHEQDSKKADAGYNQYVEDKKTAQGLDRLNQFLTFTDYAGLATGAGSLLAKGVGYAGKQIGRRIARRAIKKESGHLINPMEYVANNEVGRIKVGDALPERMSGANNFKLPNYVTPNSTANPIDLHTTRLMNGGFDKLPETVNGEKYFNTGHFSWPYKSKSMIHNMNYYDSAPTETLGSIANDFNAASTTSLPARDLYDLAKRLTNNEMVFATIGTGNVYIGKNGMLKIANNFGLKNIDRTISHEIDHALHIPGESPRGFDSSSSGLTKYFNAKNGSEYAARGSQIKDYYGLTSPDQEITEDMLRYAAKNYLPDTGMNNNMPEFFESIVDWNEAAKWLSKWSTMIATPVILNKTNDYVTKRYK